MIETAEAWSLATHNGKVTIANTESGQHRTLRIRTQASDASFMPGKRIVSILTGSDNENDYMSLGFVGDNGRIIFWKKHRDTAFERIARMLENREAWEDRGYEFHSEGRCRKCNRTLTTPRSIAIGIGPVCERGGEDS